MYIRKEECYSLQKVERRKHTDEYVSTVGKSITPLLVENMRVSEVN